MKHKRLGVRKRKRVEDVRTGEDLLNRLVKVDTALLPVGKKKAKEREMHQAEIFFLIPFAAAGGTLKCGALLKG
jgi:hypothetical protein